MYKKDKEQQEELNQGKHQCTMCSAVIYELPTILCWETWMPLSSLKTKWIKIQNAANVTELEDERELKTNESWS